ncbi:hypothetical protein [Paenibacillus artemisiicola]|uniref:hypothetical protein n=1 Tax=Paenibacillus artemisiicola TaxID=1172618 RepID=UPI001AD64DFE|nr:hypothetical protein [Paenibacillus artemisiicola]
MRKYALTKPSTSHDIKKVMIYETEHDGIYLFVYLSHRDLPAHNDFWFDDLEDAEHFSKAYFQTSKADWILIDDPMESCQHDLIRPIRRKNNSYELFENGSWRMVELGI